MGVLGRFRFTGLVRRLLIVVSAFALAATGVLTATGAAQAAGSGPCDLYSSGGTPCVAAYSTVRALYSGYNGPLYQVRRVSDRRPANVGLLAAGGYANATEQDTFCAHTTCTITELFDQSPEGNNLTIEGAGGAAGADVGANAAALPVVAGGPNGNGHMDAVNLGTECYFSPCSGSGPWVEADMENGLFSGGNGPNTANDGNNSDFVTAMLKNNGQTTYALKGGNAQSGGRRTWGGGA